MTLTPQFSRKSMIMHIARSLGVEIKTFFRAHFSSERDRRTVKRCASSKTRLIRTKPRKQEGVIERRGFFTSGITPQCTHNGKE